MSSKLINIISWSCVVLSICLIIFACFAPSLFIQCSGIIDFTNTGQIGDTIGGTMSPIIAIAGVLMTFIAFLMQVRANEIQRGQLKVSFDQKLLEQEIECRNALQLFNIDIDNTIADIKTRTECIIAFCDEIDKYPYAESACKRPSEAALIRYREIDRNNLYSGFIRFENEIQGNVDFKRAYKVLDFYSDGMIQLFHDVYDGNLKDIMDLKIQIPKLYRLLFDRVNTVTLNDSETKLRKAFNEEWLKARDLNGHISISKIKFIIEDERFNRLYDSVIEEYSEILYITNTIATISLNMSKEMRKVATMFQQEETLGMLIQLERNISQALSQNSVEELTSRFKIKHQD